MESITIKGNVVSLLAIIDFIKKWDMKVELSGTINDMDVKNELDENDKMMLFMGAFNGVFSDENIFCVGGFFPIKSFMFKPKWRNIFKTVIHIATHYPKNSTVAFVNRKLIDCNTDM